MRIQKEFGFEASHILPGHLGKCRNLHGHSYRLIVAVEGEVNPKTGFVMDYFDLKALVQPIVDQFDHTHLNYLVRYPSAENIATHIAHILYVKLIGLRLRVTVKETASTSATWDSTNRTDRNIFLLDSQDSRLGAMDAGWRSPDPGKVDDVNAAILHLESAYMDVLSQALRRGMKLTQLKLYRDSMGRPGVVKEEIEKAIRDGKQSTEET